MLFPDSSVTNPSQRMSILFHSCFRKKHANASWAFLLLFLYFSVFFEFKVCVQTCIIYPESIWKKVAKKSIFSSEKVTLPL